MTEPAGALPPFSTPALSSTSTSSRRTSAPWQHLLHGTGKTVRPHVKTHRTPELARRQLGGSAVGITCATVGEAEVMVAAGIDDVLVANEIVEPAKIERLVALAHARASLSPRTTRSRSDRSRAPPRRRRDGRVLLDVDIGLHRCGLTSAEEAVALARGGRAAPGAPARRDHGLRGPAPPHRRGPRRRRSTAPTRRWPRCGQRSSRPGFPVDVVSASGTSTLREAIADPTITELQSGVYVPDGARAPGHGPPVPLRGRRPRHGHQPAPGPGRPRRRAPGRRPGVRAAGAGRASRQAAIAVNDEHTILAMDDPVPALGSQLDLVPGQIRTTFNLHDWSGSAGAAGSSTAGPSPRAAARGDAPQSWRRRRWLPAPGRTSVEHEHRRRGPRAGARRSTRPRSARRATT